jgi:lipopolysaccharide transport system permease protein
MAHLHRGLNNLTKTSMQQYNELLKHITLREVKSRYKQSFLGFFWVVLNPFFQMLIMSFVFSFIVRFNTPGVPYPVFIFTGLLPWIFLANATGAATDAFIDNGSLIKKIYFPREIFVLATVTAKAVDFFLAFLLLLVMMLLYHIPFTPFMLFFIPLFAVNFIFVYALSLLLATCNLFFRDIKYLYNLILQLWFYVTPIIYATEFFPAQWRWIFKLNPMSVFINAYRQVLINGDYPNMSSMLIASGISFGLLALAYYVFRKLEGSFADIV